MVSQWKLVLGVKVKSFSCLQIFDIYGKKLRIYLHQQTGRANKNQLLEFHQLLISNTNVHHSPLHEILSALCQFHPLSSNLAKCLHDFPK